MKENAIKNKSFTFAVSVVKLCQRIVKEKNEFVLSRQLLRSGTGVGALVREAEQAESKLDFIHKLAIAQKEINETLYWLELLKETEYIPEEQFKGIHSEAGEIIKMLTSIIKSTKRNLR